MKRKAHVLVKPLAEELFGVVESKAESAGINLAVTHALGFSHRVTQGDLRWELPYRFTISTLRRNTTSHFRSFLLTRYLLCFMNLPHSVLSIKSTPNQRILSGYNTLSLFSSSVCLSTWQHNAPFDPSHFSAILAVPSNDLLSGSRAHSVFLLLLAFFLNHFLRSHGGACTSPAGAPCTVGVSRSLKLLVDLH
jgi:hypothetical protein